MNQADFYTWNVGPQDTDWHKRITHIRIPLEFIHLLGSKVKYYHWTIDAETTIVEYTLHKEF